MRRRPDLRRDTPALTSRLDAETAATNHRLVPEPIPVRAAKALIAGAAVGASFAAVSLLLLFYFFGGGGLGYAVVYAIFVYVAVPASVVLACAVAIAVWRRSGRSSRG